MKKILYSLFGLLFALTGCMQDNLLQLEPVAPENGEVTVKFTASIPEFKTVQTRGNGGVNDLWLLVFDQNLNFLVREKAILENQTDTGGEFTVTLPASGYKRYIHFVSNYDWTGFNDLDMLGYNVNAIMSLIITQNPGFWATVELPNGINTTCFTGPGAPTIELLRNQAKISVTETADNFELLGFTIHKAPEKGTIAPFNPTTATFEVGAITEPVGVTLLNAQAGEVNMNEKFLFERKNKNAEEITTVIVQGNYNGNTYFYKIDLINDQKVRYDIERNYHYNVDITNVSKEGYTNFSDALAGASHNNTALDPIIEKYPMLSDGTRKLQVERTLVVITEPNKTFNVWYKFFPDIVNNPTTVNNDGVLVTIMSNEGALSSAPADFSFDNATGIITAKSAATVPTVPVQAQIKVEKGELVRIIRVVLRPPFSFNPVTINNLNPAALLAQQGFNSTLRFFIPDDFPDELFPLPVNIYTQGLYAAEAGLQLFVDPGGIIRYVYTATATGLQDVEFKTNQSYLAETVKLEADYFSDATVNYTRPVGNISYGSNTPVPADATVTASVGSLNMVALGKYTYNSGGAASSTPVTVTFDEWISNGYSKRYAIATTVGDLENYVTLNLPMTYHLFNGTLRYGSGWSGTPIPASATVTLNPVIPNSIFAHPTDGYYTYDVPASANMNTSVTFTYVRSGFFGSTTYTLTRTLNNLVTNYNLRLQ
ncbi:MAG TPA: hypothetical protein GXZ56_05030 [Bacteroidales bacterium]|jgi:hypothetical protein|nr:hypothetical protein [Bacteroidales bacterium]